jgi:chemotaxis protein CheC
VKKLTIIQKDALIEICNVGMAKAATQLSVLLDTKIELTIPVIELSPAKDLISQINSDPQDRITYVSQKISDSLKGSAVVAYNSNDLSESLSKIVLGGIDSVRDQEARACEIEAVTEISNVIISSCISSIADFLTMKIGMSIPEYSEDILSESIAHMIDNSELLSEKTIGFMTKLKSDDAGIDGVLMLLLDYVSVNNLLEAIDDLFGSHDGSN